ncbi:MAG: hypothetical protein KIT33_03905 [Candidatus Kapabacteria bacterium]|nr:hypothetical protein [Ignavibacteriota bacterium]MCW5884098.1 hypothetical protein [Candidatus Kapabacteria bacterium]
MKYTALLILIMVLVSCTRQKDAFIFIDQKVEGRTAEGLYFLDVTVKNTGEQPAYFVILIAHAYKDGKDLQRLEKGYGDIFPGGSKEMRIIFDRVGILQPDSVALSLTYSPYHL